MTKFQRLQLLIGIVILLFAAGSIHAQTAQYKEGEHFFLIPKKDDEAQEEETVRKPGDKIEVTEFFAYSCPSCNRMQPFVKNWLERKPEDVVLQREHIIFRPSSVPLARAYYIAEELKVLKEVHGKIFEAMHRHKEDVRSEEALAQLFRSLAKVDSETFKEKYWAEETQERIKEGNRKASSWRISATPTLVVDGKYRVTTEGAKASYRRMFQIVDFLVAKIRKESKESKEPTESKETEL